MVENLCFSATQFGFSPKSCFYTCIYVGKTMDLLSRRNTKNGAFQGRVHGGVLEEY